MGQTLSEPVIDKHSTEDGDDRLIYAASSMQGWRVSILLKLWENTREFGKIPQAKAPLPFRHKGLSFSIIFLKPQDWLSRLYSEGEKNETDCVVLVRAQSDIWLAVYVVLDFV